jgi:hypothetical protein
MLDLSCHCGRVRLRVRKPPDFLHECNCTLCAKAGARWAYLHPSEVEVEGRTTAYVRQDKAEAGAEIRFCPTCGTITHFTLTETAAARFGNSVMGVNMRLVDENELAGVELRFPDGRAWSGEGGFTYVHPPRILGEQADPGVSGPVP